MSSQEPKVVEPCKGWNTACVFCDRRFSKWTQVENEILFSDDLVKPGLFMFVFETKQGKEVVVIGFHRSDIRAEMQKQFDILKRQVAQKKNKESKSDILVRYLTVENVECKDSCSVFSHWHNYGILPRLITKWPGVEVLKSTQHYEFNTSCNKWCHLSKDPFWRKQKAIIGPRAIKPCKGWKEKCAFCDSRFTSWLRYPEAAERAPSSSALAMFSVVDKGFREVACVESCDNLKRVVTNVAESIIYYLAQNQLHMASVEVRWFEIEDLSSENACFIYAHWINCRVKPHYTASTGKNTAGTGTYGPRTIDMPGEKLLTDSDKFILRSRDKQWCFQDEISQTPTSFSKFKEKRDVMQSIKDDLVTKT